MYMRDSEAVLFTMKELAAKEILVIWAKVADEPSLTERPVGREPL